MELVLKISKLKLVNRILNEKENVFLYIPSEGYDTTTDGISSTSNNKPLLLPEFGSFREVCRKIHEKCLSLFRFFSLQEVFLKKEGKKKKRS